MPAKRKAAAPKAATTNNVDTVTCKHCRYERPAGDSRCHICGYPWPWMGPAGEPRKGK